MIKNTMCCWYAAMIVEITRRERPGLGRRKQGASKVEASKAEDVRRMETEKG